VENEAGIERSRGGGDTRSLRGERERERERNIGEVWPGRWEMGGRRERKEIFSAKILGSAVYLANSPIINDLFS